MSTTIEPRWGGEVSVTPDEESGDHVVLFSFQPDCDVRGVAALVLEPAEAVNLSRALVKAAGEALGVDMTTVRTKEQVLEDIRVKAATLPDGPL